MDKLSIDKRASCPKTPKFLKSIQNEELISSSKIMSVKNQEPLFKNHPAVTLFSCLLSGLLLSSACCVPLKELFLSCIYLSLSSFDFYGQN